MLVFDGVTIRNAFLAMTYGVYLNVHLHLRYLRYSLYSHVFRAPVSILSPPTIDFIDVAMFVRGNRRETSLDKLVAVAQATPYSSSCTEHRGLSSFCWQHQNAKCSHRDTLKETSF